MTDPRVPHVVQSHIPRAQRPQSDTNALALYLSVEFPQRWAEIRRLNHEVRTMRTQETILVLMVEVSDFRMELDMWVPFAERLRDEQLAIGYDIASDSPERMLADAQRTRAKSEAGALIEAVEQLRATRDSLSSLSFSAQAMLKHLQTDENLAAAREDAAGAADRKYKAPVAPALRRARKDSNSQITAA